MSEINSSTLFKDNRNNDMRVVTKMMNHAIRFCYVCNFFLSVLLSLYVSFFLNFFFLCLFLCLFVCFLCLFVCFFLSLSARVFIYLYN